MKHLFSAFPAGSAGVALFLLRCSLALFLALQLPCEFAGGVWPSLALCLLVTAMIAGVWMRIVAVLAIGAITTMAIANPAPPAMLAALPHLLDALALALIGPGAFSVDAHLFGRATINLPR